MLAFRVQSRNCDRPDLLQKRIGGGIDGEGNFAPLNFAQEIEHSRARTGSNSA